MIAPDHWETQLLRLSDERMSRAICGFSEQEAFDCLEATDNEGREAVRALLQDMAHRGRLRRSGRGFVKVRVVVPATPPKEPVELPPRPSSVASIGPLFRGAP